MSILQEEMETRASPAPRPAVCQQLFELDYAIRSAIEAGDGETVRTVTDRYIDLLRILLSGDRDDWLEVARQGADMLFLQRQLAERKKDDIRVELGNVDRQRKLMEGQRAPFNVPPSLSFLA